jgi:hypothetical protein
MLCTIASKKIEISARGDRQDLEIIFGEAAVETVLCSIHCTAVGKEREADDAQRTDD